MRGHVPSRGAENGSRKPNGASVSTLPPRIQAWAKRLPWSSTSRMEASGASPTRDAAAGGLELGDARPHRQREQSSAGDPAEVQDEQRPHGDHEGGLAAAHGPPGDHGGERGGERIDDDAGEHASSSDRGTARRSLARPRRRGDAAYGRTASAHAVSWGSQCARDHPDRRRRGTAYGRGADHPDRAVVRTGPGRGSSRAAARASRRPTARSSSSSAPVTTTATPSRRRWRAASPACRWWGARRRGRSDPSAAATTASAASASPATPARRSSAGWKG